MTQLPNLNQQTVGQGPSLNAVKILKPDGRCVARFADAKTLSSE
jgi:hypothetical protein